MCNSVTSARSGDVSWSKSFSQVQELLGSHFSIIVFFKMSKLNDENNKLTLSWTSSRLHVKDHYKKSLFKVLIKHG